MKQALKRNKPSIWHLVNGKRIEGPPPEVRGNLSAVWGDLTGVHGNLTGVRGDLSAVSGDLDACDLSDEDRERGVQIEKLIIQDTP